MHGLRLSMLALPAFALFAVSASAGQYVDWKDDGTVDLKLGETRVIRVIRDGLIEAGDPTFSPDGTQLAFYGLDRDGKIDIYTLDLGDQNSHVRRLTDDLYSERDLTWGDEGIIYASDATMWKKRPAGVMVSMPSVRLRNWIRRSCKSVTKSTSPFTVRPSRSRFQSTSTSRWRR